MVVELQQLREQQAEASPKCSSDWWCELHLDDAEKRISSSGSSHFLIRDELLPITSYEHHFQPETLILILQTLLTRLSYD